jgi:hypothetical protein
MNSTSGVSVSTLRSASLVREAFSCPPATPFELEGSERFREAREGEAEELFVTIDAPRSGEGVRSTSRTPCEEGEASEGNGVPEKILGVYGIAGVPELSILCGKGKGKGSFSSQSGTRASWKVVKLGSSSILTQVELREPWLCNRREFVTNSVHRARTPFLSSDVRTASPGRNMKL